MHHFNYSGVENVTKSFLLEGRKEGGRERSRETMAMVEP